MISFVTQADGTRSVPATGRPPALLTQRVMDNRFEGKGPIRFVPNEWACRTSRVRLVTGFFARSETVVARSGVWLRDNMDATPFAFIAPCRTPVRR